METFKIINKGALSGGSDEHIFFFPGEMDITKCIKYVEGLSFNAWSIGPCLAYNNDHILRCAYSWRLSYFNRLGRIPDGTEHWS